MRLWWITDSARLKHEKAAVEKLASESGWFELSRWYADEYRLAAEGNIVVGDLIYPVKLIYPDQFPLVPAWVLPQDAQALWSRHQYGKGGSLCLELRPDNWSPSATGADVLHSACNLLRTENPLTDDAHGTVPHAPPVGSVQTYVRDDNPVLISEGCLNRIRARTAVNLEALRYHTDDQILPILISDSADRTGCIRPPEATSAHWATPLRVAVAYTEPPLNSPPTRDDLLTAVGLTPDEYDMYASLVIVVIGATDVGVFHALNQNDVYWRKVCVLKDEAGARSGRLESSSKKTVAIVGVGSLGSKVAESLIRSGVSAMVLVDGDVFLPSNLERHTLDWKDIGFLKVNGVRRRLLMIAPGASIEVIDANVNWQRSARTHSAEIEMISRCDVIVNATGDAPTGLMLGALAANNGKDFVSVEAFEGGLGALVARSMSDRDPPYASGHAAYIAYCEQQNVAPPTSGRHTYDALSESGEVIVADDAAVSIAAAHGSRVILNILDGTVSPDDRAWLLIGFKKGWLFSCHGAVVQLDVGAKGTEPANTDDADSMEFALKLLKESGNAAANSG